MRFVDLFAGLGGFHLALKRLGHECVFACEIDKNLRETYEKNFGIAPSTDIRKIRPQDIPSHDILCAGFPCQPFSKAGEQQGFDCPKWGDLFTYAVRIIRHHKPQYLLLENVPHLKRHNNGGTWEDLVGQLRRLGYSVEAERLSPHQFGIPQIRERVFIVGSRNGLSHFHWPKRPENVQLSISDVLEPNPPEARQLTAQVKGCLRTWQAFIKAMPKSVAFPACPIWSMEFGATYPYEDATPRSLGYRALSKFRGSFGCKLTGLGKASMWDGLPSYARAKSRRFPDWKVRFIAQNRAFYAQNRAWIDPWLPRIRTFPPSLQKLEWNCKGDERNIWLYVIQFRASGVRVKRPTTAPSLVAMTTTQVPIIAWEKRYMTPTECARLQSMRGLRYLPGSEEAAFTALGNAVNVKVVTRIAKALLEEQALRTEEQLQPGSKLSLVS